MYLFFFFFFNDTAPTEIYPLSLPDALPIFTRSFCCHPPTQRASARRFCSGRTDARPWRSVCERRREGRGEGGRRSARSTPDRKSTRLNSSHSQISYAVFCLKKKNIYT